MPCKTKNKMEIKDLIFEKIEGQISASTPEDFCNQFKILLKTKIGRESKGVVYIWRTQNPIPRLNGENSIIYIGKTKNSMFERHHQYAKLESSGNNWHRHEHIIKKYGAITFECAKCESPKETEKALLNEYFKEHLELPPINRTS